jgi:two-component system NtrC family response regulator
MAKILIIDDDQMLCDVLTAKLRGMAHETVCALTLEDGLRKTAVDSFDVVYLDVRLPDGNGLDGLPAILKSFSAPEVIIMTGRGDPDGAEIAIKNGAWDYIEKPSSLNTMVLPLVRALQYREIKRLKKPAFALKRNGMIGESPRMHACLDQIAQAADTDANILISGETGTGKELAARAIHSNGRRSHKNFVVLDCASLSETLVESILFGYEKGAYTGADRAHDGLIRQADGGTLFLDEVGELPFSMQRSFLRVLQERRFRPLGAKQELESDFRLITATNRDLNLMVHDGSFRGDLLYRLRAFSVEIPPLRERAGDIEELAVYHVMKICLRYGTDIKSFSPELLDMLRTYDWPGNVRELVNTMERILAVARHESTLFRKHLPEAIRIKVVRSSMRGDKQNQSVSPAPPDDPLPVWQVYRENALIRIEKQYLQNLLNLAGNDIKKACEISGLSRSRFYEILKRHKNQPPP